MNIDKISLKNCVDTEFDSRSGQTKVKIIVFVTFSQKMQHLQLYLQRLITSLVSSNSHQGLQGKSSGSESETCVQCSDNV